MCNNIYLQEKHIEEQVRNRQNDAKRQHLLSRPVRQQRRNLARHIVSRCGACLVALGTWLEHVEPREQQAVPTYK
jgi:hypothetical protein